jgi:hypothetical protein
MVAQAEKPKGRYAEVGRTPTDGLPLPRNGREWRRRDLVEAAVPNPGFGYGDKRPRVRVAVNLHSDVLEREYHFDRISERAYHAGRAYQRVLERGAGVQEQSSGERVQVAYDPGNHIVARLTAAQAVVALLDETSRITGKLGQLVLKMTLGEGLTFEEVAARMNGGSKDKSVVRFWAMTFRYSLENLGESWDSGIWA